MMHKSLLSNKSKKYYRNAVPFAKISCCLPKVKLKHRGNRSCSVLKRTKCALNFRITSNPVVEEQDHTSGVIILRSI